MAEDDVSDELLERFRQADLATLWTALSHKVRGPLMMEGVHTFEPGTRLVGRARTLRYLPTRRLLTTPPIPHNLDTPEYQAMERCGPNDVLVCDYNGTLGTGSVGDVKTYLLKQRYAEGIVMDGSIRDVKAIQGYGLKVFASGHTAIVNGIIEQYEENVAIGCGGVLVNPGDVIVGDDDGVLVVPKQIAEEIVQYAEEYDAMEAYIKELADRENVNAATYYPPDDAFRERYRREKLGQS